MIPGSQWRYSGGGFIIAQQLIEDVTGKHFQDYMKETVLDLLGMTHSTFQQPLVRTKARQIASAHGTDGKPVEGGGHVYPELAAAGLWTTPSDLCRFSIEIQKSFSGDSNKIISSEMATDMLTPGIGNWGLGMGLGAPTAEEKRTFSHGGGNKGFVCMLFAYIHKGQGAAVMTNSDRGNELVMEILRSLSSVYGWGILQPKEVNPFEMTPEKLASYVGDYRSADEPDVPILVSIEDEQLHIKSTETGDWPLYPISDTEFVYLDGGASLTFTKNPDGVYDKIERWGKVLSRANNHA